ncbi:MAG TPA: sensor histidine kinase, partial [Candidatus Nanopelagicales bacterium]|nr:sensor histidine kinase [Candidatus Nanopelagicales bacterium]
VAITTAAVIGAQLANGVGTSVAQVIGPILGAAVSIGIALGYRRLMAESERRRELVHDLMTAQEDLVATHDQLAIAQRSAGALAERARLARDIHDTLAQGFSSILLLARVGLADHSRAVTELEQIEATAADSLEEARRVVHALTPVELEDAPLHAALRRLTDRLTEQTGVRSEVTVDGRPFDVPTTIDVGLLRLAQGGLANVRQHAAAHRVAVTLTYGPQTVSLDVVDDGCGFDPTSAVVGETGGSGFGLRAMQERVAALGGELVVESAPGEGTAVSACIPTAGGRPRW